MIRQITTTVYKSFMTTVISYIGFIGVFTIATISVYLTFLKVKLI